MFLGEGSFADLFRICKSEFSKVLQTRYQERKSGFKKVRKLELSEQATANMPQTSVPQTTLSASSVQDIQHVLHQILRKNNAVLACYSCGDPNHLCQECPLLSAKQTKSLRPPTPTPADSPEARNPLYDSCTTSTNVSSMQVPIRMGSVISNFAYPVIITVVVMPRPYARGWSLINLRPGSCPQGIHPDFHLNQHPLLYITTVLLLIILRELQTGLTMFIQLNLQLNLLHPLHSFQVQPLGSPNQAFIIFQVRQQLQPP